jgi:hypothetical protein
VRITKRFNQQQPHTISTISYPILENTEEQKGFVVETFKDLKPLKLVPGLTIHSDPASHVVGKQHVFVANDFNIVAPSNLVLDSTTTFSTETTMQWKDETTKSSLISKTTIAIKLTGETDEHATTEKDQMVLRPNYFPEPHDPPLHDSNLFASFTIQSFGDVPLSLLPAKHCLVKTTLPSTEKEVVRDVATTNTPLQHTFLIFMLADVSIQIFDPGGRLTVVVCSAARRRQI